jgi:hypothetical protein
MRRQITALAAAGVLAASLSVAASWPAQAAAGEICATAGQDSGVCMNNWFGEDNVVYGYTPGKSNEAFVFEPLARCSGSDGVTATCPFADTSKDVALEGALIGQIYYNGGGTPCIGDPGKEGGVDLATKYCNGSNGTGGAYGSLFVIAGNDSLVSVGFTNSDGIWVQLLSEGSSQELGFDAAVSATEWSGL